MERFEIHCHSEYSNLRLLDCINKPDKLIDKAIELGLSGIALTDHETVAGHIKFIKHAEEVQKENPNFKIGLGNEIYLCKDRESGQKYYHFILIAKNKMGYRAIRELSSRAWMNSYYDRGMERVVTLYSDIEEMIIKYPNSLIASTACLGGELSTQAVALTNAEKMGDMEGAQKAYNNIIDFITWCVRMFGKDFYIECAPGCSPDQIKANKRLIKIAEAFNVKMVIGTDAHYLTKEDRFVHKSYLNSKGGEREVDEFYEYSYLQDNEEIIKNLRKSEYSEEHILNMFNNSQEIYNKIENFSLAHKQTIPMVEVKNYPKPDNSIINAVKEDYPILGSMFESDDIIERYWVNECTSQLKKLNKDKKEYWQRLEEEADIKRTIGEKLETNMFAYPVTLQHYVDMFWECGSIVGAGRGSSCSGLNHYLLGVTQLDPIEWNLPFWRYLNKARTELGDIDLDLCPSKRPIILQEIKAERGQKFKKEIDNLSKENLGCTLISTFGTESTKSTILTACRGYRSEEYPDGIDSDTAQYLSSLVPQERGFLWTLKDVVKGNPDKDRKPVKLFLNELIKYPGLEEIMFGIEGLIKQRGSHASGVILFDEDPYEFGCFMKTPSGDIITQWDLHDAEYAGMTKYDFLVTDVQDKIVKAIEFLQADNQIEPELTLREVYNKYFHPNVLPIDDEEIWKVLHNNSVLNIFQFDSDVGSQAAKKIKPRSILEMADANGLMRLMTSEKGQETPMEKYVRFKNNINLWYQEMTEFGLTAEEQEILKPYFLKSHGVPPSQEQLMMMLMDNDICHFTLEEANAARKIVGKKQMNKIPALREQILNQAASPCLGNYIWKCGVGPQMGYSFSIIHALAYSFIGFQTMMIATKWNPIYWNTACLVVNSGALDENSNSSTDYSKTAKALGDIISKGIKVSLVDINKSDFGFIPDVDNNQILFGMKALGGVGAPVIEAIKAGRPYQSFKDFLERCPLNKTAMISLIKSGAFDNLEVDVAKDLKIEPRIFIMSYYLSLNCDAKKRLTLQNFNGLIQKGVLDDSIDLEKRIFNFNKYLKAYKKVGQYYVFDEISYNFYNDNFEDSTNLLQVINGYTCILQKDWDKIYKKSMDYAREYIKENQEELLKKYNSILFKEAWDKYANGNISYWEMESLCFYYNEHELIDVDTSKYGIIDFEDLNPVSEIDYFFKRNGKDIPIYKTFKIIGTVISKNDAKATVSILTTSNQVVTVKFTKDYYAMFGRQISQKQPDGTKKVMEKGWFTRGTKIMVTGFRRDDMFVAKTYKNTQTHQLYKISKINNDNTIDLIHERYKPNEGEIYEEI